MKYLPELVKRSLTLSPSMRREWIEMIPPRSETGTLQMSPSMRREWIEISSNVTVCWISPVSLHAEGVD